MRIQHNIMAMNAYRNYTNNVSAMKKNLEKLSSGYKINRAGDDAAGLAISEKMRAQITGLQQAQANAKSGINLVQTAEGALTEVHDMLNRMIKLADQSANGTYDDTTDRTQLQKEVNQLLDEINRIADSSNFNGIKLLDGKLGLNTDAFEVAGTVASEDAVAGGTLAGADIISNVHGGAGQAFAAPAFAVNLDVVTGSFGAGGKFTLKIGSATITSSAVAAGGTNTAATKGDIGALFDGVHATIGGQEFKITHTTGKLTFAACTSGGGAITSISSAVAASVNAVLKGATVELTAATKAAINTPLNYDHAIQDVTLAQVKVDGGRDGADIDLSKIVGDDNTLTLGDKIWTFTISAATSAVSGQTIKLDSRKSKDEQIADAVRLLSQAAQNTANTNMQVSAKDAKTIHVDEAATNTYTTPKAFASAIKAVVSSAAAKNAGTKLKVTASAIATGNTISISDGSKTVKFVYGKGTDTDTMKYYTDKSASGLKTAIAGVFGTANVELANDTITIRAKASTTGAPTILGKGLTFQIGDTSDPWNQLNVAVQDMHTKSLGIDGLDISTEEAAQAAIDKIKAAINTVSDVRGTLGATQNRLDHTINNLSVMTENIQDAESTIRDTDVAEEMMAYTKNNILIQSAQAMLAQANQVPQGVLQLLQ